MREYYLFLINNHFSSFYKNKPREIYEMLKQIYTLNPKEIGLGYKLYRNICLLLNKCYINEYIYNNHCFELTYEKKDNTHIIKNIYHNEFIKLSVNNVYIKIISNKSYNTFMSTINNYSNYFFVCDFKNNDYFWLNKVSIDTLV